MSMCCKHLEQAVLEEQELREALEGDLRDEAREERAVSTEEQHLGVGGH